MRAVPTSVTATDLESALSELPPEKRNGWAEANAGNQETYLRATQQFGGEPPELTDLLDATATRTTWDAQPQLVRWEQSRWVNMGTTGFGRRRRAHALLKELRSGDLP